ncbi:hypothetical protein [Streptomyces sp. ISL-100]|uniref:hypothetical protein n=1 Tax=Streptomyces sp. ISL-100 TaxID=2819173 RepID=UPI001BE81F87|nr:hypothetical protein [Streptomyces sp. ISL-100]MBT2396199.1 hypothetical protein [Streptomyces sp. ISL-100]
MAYSNYGVPNVKWPRSSPRAWSYAAVAAALGASGLYVWGFISLFGTLDIEEFCTLTKHQKFDPEYAYIPEQWFPLSQKCNATYDLVPPYVNSGVLALAGIALACVVTAMAIAVKRKHGANGTHTDDKEATT